jgi:hypothetical protein
MLRNSVVLVFIRFCVRARHHGKLLEIALKYFNEKFLEVQKPFFKKVFGRRRQKWRWI